MKTTIKKPEKITLLMLAKDVLKWLRPGSKVRLVPRIGYGYIGNYLQRGDVQTHLKAGKSCTVCGIGALAAAAAFRKDELQFDAGGWINSSCLREACVQIIGLGYEEAMAIEEAFEYGVGLKGKYKSAKDRLTQICKNIVKNKGTFIPYQY